MYANIYVTFIDDLQTREICVSFAQTLSNFDSHFVIHLPYKYKYECILSFALLTYLLREYNDFVYQRRIIDERRSICLININYCYFVGVHKTEKKQQNCRFIHLIIGSMCTRYLVWILSQAFIILCGAIRHN